MTCRGDAMAEGGKCLAPDRWFIECLCLRRMTIECLDNELIKCQSSLELNC